MPQTPRNCQASRQNFTKLQSFCFFSLATLSPVMAAQAGRRLGSLRPARTAMSEGEGL